MKLTVIKQQIAELTEINVGIENGCPIHFQSPYYINNKGRNVISQFEFLTRQNVISENGKRKYFDMDLSFADQFKTFNEALNVAMKFKNNDETGVEEYFIIGYTESLIVEMKIKANKEDFYSSIKR